MPTRARHRAPLSSELLCPPATSPGSHSSQCHGAETGPEVETVSTLSVSKLLMSTCYVPGCLLGENQTNANLVLPGANQVSNSPVVGLLGPQTPLLFEVFGSQDLSCPSQLGLLSG